MRSDVEKPIIDVAVAVIHQNGKYLITRRHENVHLAGLWEFPGGKCLPDETLERCLVREAEEELGVAIDIGRPLYQGTHDYPDRTVRLHVYLCALTSGVPEALASQEVRWVAPEALLEYPFPEANLPFLRRLMESGPHPFPQTGGQR